MSSFYEQSQQRVHSEIDRQLDRTLQAVGYSDREKVALSCRYLADEGHAKTLAGQVTVRAEQPGTFWTTHFGSGFADVRVSNLVRVDSDMNVIEGEGMANPAVRFHLWVYRARPEVCSIVHTHATHAAALAMTRARLLVAHMDTAVFFNDCAYLEDWPGVPVANEEGRLITEALGSARSILLSNHGLLTVGTSLDEAVYLAGLFEHAARLQLLATASGAPIAPIAPERAQEAHDFLLKPRMISQTVDYWLRQAAHRHPDALT